MTNCSPMPANQTGPTTSAEFVQAEKYFLAIANTTEDMIHLNDLDSRIIYSNHATEKVLGYPLDEIVNASAMDIIHPDDRQAIESDMRSVAANGGVPPRTIRLLKNLGGLWLVQECRRTWTNQGEVLSYDDLTRLADEAGPFAAGSI